MTRYLAVATGLPVARVSNNGFSAFIDSNGRVAEASPCGACRQVMIEQEQRQGKPLRTLVTLGDGRVREYNSVADLLPFVFAAEL